MDVCCKAMVKLICRRYQNMPASWIGRIHQGWQFFLGFSAPWKVALQKAVAAFYPVFGLWCWSRSLEKARCPQREANVVTIWISSDCKAIWARPLSPFANMSMDDAIALFHRFDVNGNGTLGFDELREPRG